MKTAYEAQCNILNLTLRYQRKDSLPLNELQMESSFSPRSESLWILMMPWKENPSKVGIVSNCSERGHLHTERNSKAVIHLPWLLSFTSFHTGQNFLISTKFRIQILQYTGKILVLEWDRANNAKDHSDTQHRKERLARNHHYWQSIDVLLLDVHVVRQTWSEDYSMRN